MRLASLGPGPSVCWNGAPLFYLLHLPPHVPSPLQATHDALKLLKTGMELNNNAEEGRTAEARRIYADLLEQTLAQEMSSVKSLPEFVLITQRMSFWGRPLSWSGICSLRRFVASNQEECCSQFRMVK